MVGVDANGTQVGTTGNRFSGATPAYVGVLGDSQTMSAGNPLSVTAASYDINTGVLTLTRTGHGLATGAPIRLGALGKPQFNTNPAVGKAVTVIDANTFTVQLAAGIAGTLLAADVRFHRWTYAETGHFMSFLRSLYGDRFDVSVVAGMTGESLGQIRSRITREITPNAPVGSIIIVQGGHNDVTTGVTLAQSKIDVDGITSDLIYYGYKVIWLTCSAFGSGLGTTANRAAMLEINRKIRSMPTTYKNVAVVDVATISSDPTTLFNLKANYSTDNLHWSPRLSKLIAGAIGPVIATWLPVQYTRLPISLLDCYDSTNNPGSSNLMQNALLNTVTGGSLSNGILGVLGAQWNAATTSASGALLTCSVQANSWGGAGNSAKLTATAAITYAGGGDVVRFYSSGQQARFLPGQKVRVGIRAKTSGYAGMLLYCTLHMYSTVDGVSQGQVAANGYSTATLTANDQADIDFPMIGELYIPVGASLTSLYWQLTVYCAGTAALGSYIEAGQAEMTIIG